jgi:L,D-transpeptidase ErfK/SrfK
MRALIKLLIIFLASAYSCAFALTFPIHQDTEVVGEVITFKAKYEDTFAHYARTYDMGAYALERANPGVDEWIPGEGTKITIPSAFILPPETRQGIVINLPELRLYYYDQKNGQVSTYPIGIGKAGWSTPVTTGKVTDKTENPTWVVPASILAEHKVSGEPIPGLVGGAVPPGEHNPLGKYRLRLSIPGYLIHGTNSPIGVGRRVTHGCVRMFPVDVEELFNKVPVGTPVLIVNDPIKLGWKNNELYLEVHQSLEEHPLNTNQRKVLLVDKLEKALAGKQVNLNWDLIHNMMTQQSGVAQMITHTHTPVVTPAPATSEPKSKSKVKHKIS